MQQIERLKTQLDLLPDNKVQEKYTRQKMLLKSALFSARIEGNPKTLEELEREGFVDSQEKHHLEITNLYQVLEYILKINWQKPLTLDDIRQIHQRVMQNLTAEAGFLRAEPSAIYNSAGVAVYVCPLPNEIKDLLVQLLTYCNNNFETIIPIKTALIHVAFEKIHPFLDGNGRVGRLLIHLALKKDGYDLRGLVPIEEYLDQHRQTYYDLLLENKQDRTEFVEFFLDAMIEGLQTAVALKTEQKTKKLSSEDDLPLRRFEILQIIKDHKIASFDFLKRRFLKIPERTLRYDLKQLVDKGFIKKRGITRGSVYEILARS